MSKVYRRPDPRHVALHSGLELTAERGVITIDVWDEGQVRIHLTSVEAAELSLALHQLLAASAPEAQAAPQAASSGSTPGGGTP